MTYQTPELLLVGAAKNVVLGEYVGKQPSHRNYDLGNILYTVDSTFDSETW